MRRQRRSWPRYNSGKSGASAAVALTPSPHSGDLAQNHLPELLWHLLVAFEGFPVGESPSNDTTARDIAAVAKAHAGASAHETRAANCHVAINPRHETRPARERNRHGSAASCYAA